MFKKLISAFKNAWSKHIVQDMPPVVESKERELKSHSPFQDRQIHPTQGILGKMMPRLFGTRSSSTRKKGGNRHRAGLGGGTFQPMRRHPRGKTS